MLIPVPVQFDFVALCAAMVILMHHGSVHTQGLETFEAFVAKGAPERFVLLATVLHCNKNNSVQFTISEIAGNIYDLCLIFTCAVNFTLTFLLVPVLKLLGSCLVFMDVDHEVSLGSE